jgi:hypothetical protein
MALAKRVSVTKIFLYMIYPRLVKTEKGTEIPARTGLGATTVLSIVTIGFSGKR